jgi:alpha-L-fucosidase
VLKALAEECEKQGIKLFFYYSQLDWHHPDYYPRGQTGRDAGRPDSGDFNRYIDFMNAQLTELLTNYGPVAGIWFDGWWDRPDANWRLAETYALIHRLQPAALIGSNHHRAPNPGEDFQMFEKDLPGHNTAGFSGEAEIGDLPLEYCDTISGAWGFNINDRRYKDTKTLVHMLVRAAGYNSNLLLNVGPMPDGRIQPEFAERLRDVGAWLAAHGESIYGTRGGPVTPRPWGVTTHEGEHRLRPRARLAGRGPAAAAARRDRRVGSSRQDGRRRSRPQPVGRRADSTAGRRRGSLCHGHRTGAAAGEIDELNDVTRSTSRTSSSRRAIR